MASDGRPLSALARENNRLDSELRAARQVLEKARREGQEVRNAVNTLLERSAAQGSGSLGLVGMGVCAQLLVVAAFLYYKASNNKRHLL